MWRRASFAPVAVILSLLLVSVVFAARQREAERGEPRTGGGRRPPSRPTEPTDPSEPTGPTGPREPDGPGDPATPAPPPALACGGSVLCAAEVAAIVTTAAAALSTDTLTVAVVDRLGNPLALFRKPGATGAADDRAVGLARTAAWFSNDQASCETAETS